MKKALLTLAAVAMAGSSYAQGLIGFSNADIPNAAGTGTYNALIKMPNGTANADSTFTVGLFNGSTLLTSTTIVGTTGLFLGDEVAVAGAAPGSRPTLTVRAWNTSAGSFAAATTRGEASFQTAPLGGPNPTPPPPSIFTPGLTGFGSETTGIGLVMQTVPEPSTYALGALGLGALAMMRRRKA
jgi:hypothetical protein